MQSSLSGALSFKPSCSICTALTIDFFSPDESLSLRPPNEEQLLLYPYHVGAGEHGDTLFRVLLASTVVILGCKGLPGLFARPEQHRYNWRCFRASSAEATDLKTSTGRTVLPADDMKLGKCMEDAC